MLFILTMIGTIASFHLYYSLSDEISRLITGLLSQMCLLLSLIYAPWFIKIVVVIAIIRLLPNYRRTF